MFLHAVTLRSGLEHKSPLSQFTAALKLHVRAMGAPHLTRGWLDLLNSPPSCVSWPPCSRA